MKDKVNLLLILAGICMSNVLSAQTDNCFKKFEDAFAKRGSYTVADEMHMNVIICYFEKVAVSCVSGKVRVENGMITNVWLQYDDNSYDMMDKKFYNEKKLNPTITNGISEMINTADGEKFRIVFIEKLKPKSKTLKEVTIPDDL